MILLLVIYNKIRLSYNCTVITVHCTVHIPQNKKRKYGTRQF